MLVLGRAVKDTGEAIEDVTAVALQIGLTISVSKIKYMIHRKKNINEPEESEINWRR
jgi:hypothetical protein